MLANTGDRPSRLRQSQKEVRGMGSTLLEKPEMGWDEDETSNEVRVERPMTKTGKGTQKILRDTFRTQSIGLSNADFVVVGWMAAMHLGCLVAPFFFTWSALGVCLAFYWLTGTVGVTLGYHRYLAHRSFKLSRPAEFFVYMLGVLSMQGSPLMWAATHRVHHARSDKDGDPHSPRHGKWWSHMIWLLIDNHRSKDPVFVNKVCPDLVKDPMIQFFEKTFVWWTVAFGIAMLAIGGLPWLLWGLCVRVVITYHATWFVNSATHLWGYRTYETGDDSRNLWWVALVTGGEGWHNNHHAYPRVARAGHQWWEFDTTYGVILLLKSLGQAWDVNDKLPDATRKGTPKLAKS
ncbi:fatty acid desaturase [bacterium]|nr:fatty acid desaturase [bacterium]